MRQRRETVERPFGTLKMRMGVTHFLMKRLPKVATEMALHVLAYNPTRVMNIMGSRSRGRDWSAGRRLHSRRGQLRRGDDVFETIRIEAIEPGVGDLGLRVHQEWNFRPA